MKQEQSLDLIHIPANTRRLPNVGTMLDQRRRRWANVVLTLGECFVFVGYLVYYYTSIFNVSSILGQRRKQWTNIELISGKI